MPNKTLLITVTILILSCISTNEVKKNDSLIMGDWHIYYFDATQENNSEETFDYIEVFFSENKMYRFSNMGSVMTPIHYMVTDNSLYFGTTSEIIAGQTEYVGDLVYKNKDTLFVTNKKDTITFFKIPDNRENMSNYIGLKGEKFKEFDTSFKKFHQGFLKRVHECFEKEKN